MNSLIFAETARRLGQATQAFGYDVPIFRGPPRRPNTSRSISRNDGSVTVAVRLSGRPLAAVMADMVEGTIRANQLAPGEASELRDALWSACSDLLQTAPTSAPRHLLASDTRVVAAQSPLAA